VIHNSRIAPVTTRIVVKRSEAKRREEKSRGRPRATTETTTENQNHKNHVYTKPKFS